MSTAHPTPTSEPAPLAAADLADANGWRDPAALAVPDTVMLGTLADWGIWPDDHAPDPGEPLGEQFARQIGAGEAVEYFETFELIRAIAHADHGGSLASASYPIAHPSDRAPRFTLDDSRCSPQQERPSQP